MKNNIEYYQHFCNSDQHPKFKMLRVKYGWEGEGKFWALNNKIGLSDNCRIDLNKKYNKAGIANDLNFNLKEFDEFIEYLDKECNLIIKKNGFITTEIIIENLEKVMNKRKRNQIDYKSKIKETLSNIKPPEIKIQPSEKIQSKVKESKVNKTKVKREDQNYIFIFFDNLLFKELNIRTKQKKDIEQLIKDYGCLKVFYGFRRAKIFYLEIKKNKWKVKYGKKWSRIYENFDWFISDNNLNEKLAEIKGWNIKKQDEYDFDKLGGIDLRDTIKKV